jgi:hypothetical protein
MPEGTLSLADKIRDLERRIMTDLRESNDYREHTAGIWRLVEQLAGNGRC